MADNVTLWDTLIDAVAMALLFLAFWLATARGPVFA